MKKIILLGLILVISLGLVGCFSTNDPIEDEENGSGNNGSGNEVVDKDFPYELTGTFADQVFIITNWERTRRGLNALERHQVLTTISQEHTQDMASNNFMSHTGSDSSTVRQRIERAGINLDTGLRGWGENVARGQRTPQQVVTAWMNSAGHRANILNENFTHLGVGFVGGNYPGAPYWTQKFLTLV